MLPTHRMKERYKSLKCRVCSLSRLDIYTYTCTVCGIFLWDDVEESTSCWVFLRSTSCWVFFLCAGTRSSLWGTWMIVDVTLQCFYACMVEEAEIFPASCWTLTGSHGRSACRWKCSCRPARDLEDAVECWMKGCDAASLDCLCERTFCLFLHDPFVLCCFDGTHGPVEQWCYF